MTVDGLEQREHRIEIDDMTVHVTDIGQGAPLVMLHGGGPGASAMSNFRGNIELLGSRYRLLLIDQPGFGASSKSLPAGESYFRLSARCVNAVLRSLGEDKAHLLGNSLGGGTCLRFALDFPEMVDRLVLMGPGGGAVNVLSAAGIEQAVRESIGRFYAEPTVERMREFCEFMVYDPSTVSDALVAERFEAAVDPDATASIANLFAALALDPEKDLWKDVDRVHHPTLLVWGREDPVLPFESSLLMFHRMPDVRLAAFAQCGHWVQAEKQPEFDRLVADFLG